MSAEKSLNMNKWGKMLKLNQEIFHLQEITALNNFATGGGLAHSVAWETLSWVGWGWGTAFAPGLTVQWNEVALDSVKKVNLTFYWVKMAPCTLKNKHALKNNKDANKFTVK